jgi:hemolysin activation/secretion protein
LQVFNAALSFLAGSCIVMGRRKSTLLRAFNKRSGVIACFVCVSACVLPVSVAVAQSLPSADGAAQELLRQQERERALRQQQGRPPDVRLDTPVSSALPRLSLSESPCFRIDRLTLSGDAADQFQWALAAANPSDDPALGQCLGAEAINLTLTRVQNAIIARG